MVDTREYIRTLAAENPPESIGKLQALLRLYQENAKSDKALPEYNHLILLKGQYLSAIQDFNLGLIKREEREVVVQRIRVALLQILDKVPEAVFSLNEQAKDQLLAGQLQKDIISEKVNQIVRESQFRFDLFFSFASQNRAAARQLVSQLRGYGLRIFFSDESLKERVGESFVQSINQALDQSNHFLWFCTPESTTSAWVRLECEIFFNQVHLPDAQKRRFFIFKGQGFDPGLLPMLYRNLQFADKPEQIIQNLPNAQQVSTEYKRANPVRRRWGIIALISAGSLVLFMALYPRFTSDPTFATIDKEKNVVPEMHIRGAVKCLDTGKPQGTLFITIDTFPAFKTASNGTFSQSLPLITGKSYLVKVHRTATLIFEKPLMLSASNFLTIPVEREFCTD